MPRNEAPRMKDRNEALRAIPLFRDMLDEKDLGGDRGAA